MTVGAVQCHAVAADTFQRRIQRQPSKVQVMEARAHHSRIAFQKWHCPCSNVQTDWQHFQPYHPLLRNYPQLATSTANFASNMTLPSPSLPNGGELDWRLLSSIMLTHRLQRDPSATMCRSEAAGGRCADDTCQDIHLVRSAPTGACGAHGSLQGRLIPDSDLAAYVVQAIARQSAGEEEPDVATINAALMLSRQEMERRGIKSPRHAMDASALTMLLDLTTRHVQNRAR